MHTDARSLDDHSTIEGDICIIGAGAAGISVALEWILSPYRIILLEGGGFEYEARMQELYRGKTTGQPYYPLQSARLHYFGGTTGHWGGMCSVFDPVAFKKRDWISDSGWPFTQEHMMPYYERAHSNLDLGTCDFSSGVALTNHCGHAPPSPTSTAIYCLPSTMNEIGGALIADPVSKRQSRSRRQWSCFETSKATRFSSKINTQLSGPLLNLPISTFVDPQTATPASLAVRNLAGWLAPPPDADTRELTQVRAKALGANQ